MTTVLSSVIRSHSPFPEASSAMSQAISKLVPEMPEEQIHDLLKLHSWYIKGPTVVSGELGKPGKTEGSSPSRSFVIFPNKGTMVDLLHIVGGGADKRVRRVLYIDAMGKISVKALSIFKRGQEKECLKIARRSQQFFSRHILRFQHLQFGNHHFLLSPLKNCDAYDFFRSWKYSIDPSPILLDVFIGAFKGVATLLGKGYVHTDLQNPKNTLVEKMKSGRCTGVLADLDRLHQPSSEPIHSLKESDPSKPTPQSDGKKLKKQDVHALFLASLQTIQDMKRFKEFPNLVKLKGQIEKLIDMSLPAAEAAQALQALKNQVLIGQFDPKPSGKNRSPLQRLPLESSNGPLTDHL